MIFDHKYMIVATKIYVPNGNHLLINKLLDYIAK